MNIQTIIIDYSIDSRECIKSNLQSFPEIRIIAEADSGSKAVKLINKYTPLLIFLNIKMPDLSGFEIMQKINTGSLPFVIFIADHDKYAVKAFEFHAIDFLLKPIDIKRFNSSVMFAVNEIQHRAMASGNGNHVSKLPIKTKGEIFFIQAEHIDWIESAGDYVYVHSNQKKHILRQTLTSLEEHLDPQKFLRIHRSVIVNIDRINKLRHTDHSDFDVFLNDGTKLKLSRTYRTNLERITGYSL